MKTPASFCLTLLLTSDLNSYGSLKLEHESPKALINKLLNWASLVNDNIVIN